MVENDGTVKRLLLFSLVRACGAEDEADAV